MRAAPPSHNHWTRVEAGAGPLLREDARGGSFLRGTRSGRSARAARPLSPLRVPAAGALLGVPTDPGSTWRGGGARIQTDRRGRRPGSCLLRAKPARDGPDGSDEHGFCSVGRLQPAIRSRSRAGWRLERVDARRPLLAGKEKWAGRNAREKKVCESAAFLLRSAPAGSGTRGPGRGPMALPPPPGFLGAGAAVTLFSA